MSILSQPPGSGDAVLESPYFLGQLHKLFPTRGGHLWVMRQLKQKSIVNFYFEHDQMGLFEVAAYAGYPTPRTR